MSVVPSAPRMLDDALTYLTCWSSGLEMVRIGGEGDGGYLVPDDFAGVSQLLSPGVADSWEFERELGERYGIHSTMIDGSVDAPQGLGELQTFDRKWLASTTGPGRISLNDWVWEANIAGEGDLALQMDIEGAEYGVLKTADPNALRRFRWAVVEFHGLDLMRSAIALRLRFLPVFRKMSQVFRVVHVHPNNCCGSVEVAGVTIPRVLEVTYLRRDRFLEGGPMGWRPHSLDRDCVSNGLPVKLPVGWPLRDAEDSP